MLQLVVAPLFFFAGFIIYQKLIQHEMEERLENSLLQSITIEKAEIQWFKNNKEAIINGRLFDVKSVQISGTKITLTGLYDDKEKELKEAFVNIMHRKKSDSIPADYFIIKLIFNATFFKESLIAIPSLIQQEKILYHCYDEAIVSQISPLKTQPPNI